MTDVEDAAERLHNQRCRMVRYVGGVTQAVVS